MPNTKLETLFLDQSNDLIWMVDANLLLTYANQAYLNLMKQVTGKEKRLFEPVLLEGFGEGYIEKWRGYYQQALSGDYFEIEEHYSHPETNEIKYGQIIFNPIRDDNQRVIAVACQSRDITRIVKQRSDAHQLMDASLDVFCTINEAGNFVFVSEAASQHWGYSPKELIGVPYISLVIEEDITKTNDIANAILNGEQIKSFVNRYKRKDGDIAYNLWSARWDKEARLMYGVAKDAKEKIEQEKLLHQSEQRFKALVQEGADLIAILNADGTYRYVSPTSFTILGMQPEEFLGRSPFEFIHPDDAERTMASLQKITEQHKVQVEPFRFKNNKNEWRWIETVLTNMLDNTAVNGIVANSRDITENVTMLKEIEANEQFNKTVIESSPDCLKILDNEGRLLFMNFNGMCQMEIDDFSEFKNKQWWLLWGPENEALVRESVEKALKGEMVQFSAFCPTAKGTPKWWDVTVSPVSEPGAPIQKIISVSRDITAKKEEEQRLKLLESVITNTRDAVLITEAEPFDEPGPGILYVNEAFTRMTGYTAEEVIGKSPRILQGPKSDKAELARLGKALRNWEPCEITTINYKKNGEEFWINLSVSPVADKKGWYTHWISIERDVTEQKNKEQQKELLGKISLSFSIENDLISSAGELCKTISEFGQFDFTELWLPNVENTKMQLIACKPTTPIAETFYECSKDVKLFEIAAGLPGMVWLKKASVLWSDISKKDDFIRKEAAIKAGIQTVLGIPLLFNKKCVGVLLIGTQHKSNYLKKYVKVFERLEHFIGSEINRKRLENDLNHLYEAIPDILCLADFEGRFLKMNKAGCDLLGYPEEEIIYHAFDEFVHPGDKDITRNEVMKLGLGQTTLKFENRYLTKTGNIVWLSWTCNSVVQEGLIYATAKNITEKAKLRELNRLSNSLAKIGSWEVDMLSGTIYWSDMVHELHETDPGSFVPMLEDAINFYREDFREMVKGSIEKCMSTGMGFDFEAVLVTAKKNERWVRAIGNAELVDGQCKRIYGSFQDIHDSKMMELQMREILGSISDAFYAVDKDWNFTYFNKEAETLLLKKEAEVIGKNIWKLFPATHETLIEEVYYRVAATGKSESFEYFYPGDNKWYELNVYSSLGGVSAYFKNIDERKQAAEKLEKTYQEKNNIIESIADAFFTMNRNFIVSNWNRAAEEMIGVKREQLIGKSLWEVFPDAVTLPSYTNYHKVLATGKAITFEDHYGIWLEVNAYPSEEGLTVFFRDISLRKEADQRLLKAFEEKNNILESIGDAFFAVDNNWLVTYWNKEAEIVLGKKREDIVGRHLWSEYADAIDSNFYRQYHKAMETGENITFEEYYPTLGKWFEVSAYPSQNSLSVYFKDVTLRKEADLRLTHANQEKTRILERITEAFVSLDTNWCYTYMNKQAGEIFNRDPEKIIGKHIWTEFPEGLNQPFHLAYEKAMATQEYIYLEEHYKPYDLWFENHIYPSPDGISIFFRDVTERKRSEEKLRQSNERFEKVTEATNDAIWDYDVVNNHLFWGKGFYTLFGYDPDQIKPSFDLLVSFIHNEDRERIAIKVKQYMTDPALSNWFEEYRFLKADQSYAFVIDRAMFLRNEAGNVIRVVGAMTDITYRKDYEESLRKLNTILDQRARQLAVSNAELEQFAYIASHDLQEPLRMVTSFLTQVDKHYSSVLDDKGKQYIYFAVDGAKRMRQIILDLLEYSRIGRAGSNPEQVHLNDLIVEIKFLFKRQIEEKDASISSDPLPVLVSHRSPLRQLFQNLIGNALKYSDEKRSPQIHISVKETDGHFEFCVKDNGIGIDEEFFEKIFIIFQRLHNKDEYSGTGMGLSISKKIVESMGGKIWVQSTPGEGSSFYFTVAKPVVR